MKCQKCGFANPGNNKFCGHCGCAMASTAAPPISAYNANYLPKHISDKIIAVKPEVEGERKVITVLFTDVVNYTSFSEKLDLEVIQAIMNVYFKMLIELVYAYEGVVDQLLGDGMMVFFGAPLAHEDHAQRACHCALAMQAATREYSEQMRQQYGIDFKVRVGINSGPVFVGTIGNNLHMEYLAIGNTVNLASKIQNAASPEHILVSDNTYYLAKYFFNFETIRDVAVKGKEEPIVAYDLLDAKKIESRFDAAVVEGLSRFCGREAELAALGKALSEVEKGNGRAVGIMGEPGIGKSRLIREFRASLTPGEGAFFEGRCLHHGNSVPYMPLIDILRSFFNIEEGDAESRWKEKIIAKARQLDGQLVDDLPFIYEIFSLNIQDKSYFNIAPEHRRNKMFTTITRLLVKESSQQPVIVVIEDLHWIDEISQELLVHLIQKLKNSPVLFLLSYRPEYAPPWKNQPGYMQIHLGQLSAPNIGELLESLLPDGDLTPELTALVLAKAGGNPLFVEEYVYALLEDGTIRKGDGRYSINGSRDSIKLPDTLQGIIASRIDRLPPDLKNTLQVASVIGRDFGYDVLRAVLQTPHKLKTQLENLENLEFVVESSIFSETEYTFKHALIQEVAYGGLSNKKQQDLHENVAGCIEKIYSDRLEEFLDVLAYHFRKGVSLDKALDYCIRAGNRAQAAFANQAAIEYFKKALELCSKFAVFGDGIGARLHEKLGIIYLLKSDYNQALESCEDSYRLREKFEEAVNSPCKASSVHPEVLSKYLPPQANSQERLATLYLGRSQICFGKSQYDEGLDWVDRGITLSGISDSAKARLLCVRCKILWHCSEYATGLDCGQKALEYACKIDDDDAEVDIYSIVGSFYHVLADNKRAMDYYRRGLDISIRLQRPDLEAKMLCWLGVCYWESGDWENAENYYKKSLSIAEKIGYTYIHVSALVNISDLLMRRGHVEQLEESIACGMKALDLYGKTGDKHLVSVIYNNLCIANIKLSNWQKAKEYVDEALASLEHVPAKLPLYESYLELAEVHLNLGETEKALHFCQKSLDIVIEMKSMFGQGEVLPLMGRIYHSLGQWNKAEQMFRDSLRIFENIGLRPDEMALTIWYLAILYQDMNEANFRNIPRSTIRELVQRALEIWTKLKISYDETLVSKLMNR